MDIAIETALGLALFVPLAAVAQPQTSAPAGAWADINGDNVIDVYGNLRWWTRPHGKRVERSVDKAWSLARAHRGQGISSKGKDNEA
jgi:hypothetical protein